MYLIARVRNACEVRMRRRVFRALLGLDTATFAGKGAYKLNELLAEDARAVGRVLDLVVDASKATGKILIGLSYLALASPIMLAVTVAMIPAGVGILHLSFGHYRRASKLSRESASACGAQGSEVLAAFETVRTAGAEPFEGDRYDRAVGEYEAKSNATAASYSLHLVNFIACQSFAMTAWMAVGALLSAWGLLTMGQVTSIISHSQAAATGFGALADQQNQFFLAGNAVSRLFQVLDAEPRIETSGKARPLGEKVKIEFENVRFGYPGARGAVLRGIDFTLLPGQTTAICGPSGSGKTTVANLLLRHYDTTGGQILVDGEPLRELAPPAWRRQVGVVPQEPMLLGGTIRSNIAYGFDATDEDVRRAARLAHAHDFIENPKVMPQGYDTPVGAGRAKLSGGQKQRVALARALLTDTGAPPKVLILDEATSALDAESEAAISKALKEIKRDRTVLVIAHRLKVRSACGSRRPLGEGAGD